MNKEVRILMVEDMPVEAELTLRQLRRDGLDCVVQRVDDERGMSEALQQFEPQLILSDFTLPGFDGLAALDMARSSAPDIPFIFVSGTIGEERAIEALKRGAWDYVLKTNLARLAAAVRRALDDADSRRERLRQQAQIARLTRVLRMLSGVNAVLPRIRDRHELLKEACRLAVAVGGYSAAVVVQRKPRKHALEAVAWMGEDSALTPLRAAASTDVDSKTSVPAEVLRSVAVFVSNDVAKLDEKSSIRSGLLEGGHRSLVALPLVVDKTAIGVLMLTAHETGIVSQEELHMLQEVAGNISFALQYLHKEDTVRLLSYFDSQTGLAKRALFCERLDRLIAEGAARRARFAAVVFDIERLSVINDSFGRHTGDRLLQHFADRLRGRFGGTQKLAHLSGGTFAVMLEHSGRPEDLMGAVNSHFAALIADPFAIEMHAFPVTLKSGVASSPENGNDANELLQNAEAALRDARASGERHVRHCVEASSAVVARLALEHKLRAALEHNQFELHYQPKVNVKTRRVEGLEALLRWRDPDNGLVPPAHFLSVLESSTLIVPVGEWVISRAIQDRAHWMSMGVPGVRVAVNISPVQLRSPDFTRRFLEITVPLGAGACGLDIEITEGVLLDDSPAEIRKLQALRAMGAHVAIDDFGTGYSSLSRLAELPIDTLKIDRKFISQLGDGRTGRQLVTTIIELARTFGMTTVAEGVETQEQLDALWQLGCDQSQGFLHSKAVAADEIANLLQHGHGHVMLPAAAAGPEAGRISAGESAVGGRACDADSSDRGGSQLNLNERSARSPGKK